MAKKKSYFWYCSKITSMFNKEILNPLFFRLSIVLPVYFTTPMYSTRDLILGRLCTQH